MNPTLSPRQQQILTLLADGHTNSQIGQMMFLSEETIKTHLRRAYRTLGVRNRAQAVLVAHRLDLLHTPGTAGPLPSPAGEATVAVVVERLVAAGFPRHLAYRVARGHQLGPGIHVTVTNPAERPKAPRGTWSALRGAFGWPARPVRTPTGGGHRYLSTGCLHGHHDYCRNPRRDDGGLKVPGRCKFCPATCVCPCHQTATETD